jgi:acrylyl-CoA reductase (NADPH)
MTDEQFSAFVVRHEDGAAAKGVTTLSVDDLPEGDVTVRVAWSSVNYKDGLAASPTGRIARISPLVPGIDLAGRVVTSDSPEFSPGDEVLAHGYDLGVSHHGGYAELARLPAEWVVPLPGGLGLRDAMAIGTAGYTAALSVLEIEARGLEPGGGPVLVLGASGGVGSTAVAILARRGHEVWASTGKADEAETLHALGAQEILSREETSAESGRPLESERWAACVDPVGGPSLAYVLRTLRYGGTVASSGLTGGPELRTTVLPFILRGAALVGMESSRTPIERRRETWRLLGEDLRPAALDRIARREVTLDELPDALDDILAGRSRGRTVVHVGGEA